MAARKVAMRMSGNATDKRGAVMMAGRKSNKFSVDKILILRMVTGRGAAPSVPGTDAAMANLMPADAVAYEAWATTPREARCTCAVLTMTNTALRQHLPFLSGTPCLLDMRGDVSVYAPGSCTIYHLMHVMLDAMAQMKQQPEWTTGMRRAYQAAAYAETNMPDTLEALPLNAVYVPALRAVVESRTRLSDDDDIGYIPPLTGVESAMITMEGGTVVAVGDDRGVDPLAVYRARQYAQDNMRMKDVPNKGPTECIHYKSIIPEQYLGREKAMLAHEAVEKSDPLESSKARKAQQMSILAKYGQQEAPPPPPADDSGMTLMPNLVFAGDTRFMRDQQLLAQMKEASQLH